MGNTRLHKSIKDTWVIESEEGVQKAKGAERLFEQILTEKKNLQIWRMVQLLGHHSDSA